MFINNSQKYLTKLKRGKKNKINHLIFVYNNITSITNIIILMLKETKDQFMANIKFLDIIN